MNEISSNLHVSYDANAKEKRIWLKDWDSDVRGVAWVDHATEARWLAARLIEAADEMDGAP